MSGRCRKKFYKKMGPANPRPHTNFQKSVFFCVLDAFCDQKKQEDTIWKRLRKKHGLTKRKHIPHHQNTGSIKISNPMFDIIFLNMSICYVHLWWKVDADTTAEHFDGSFWGIMLTSITHETKRSSKVKRIISNVSEA